jgi:DNA topoisomerase-1
MYITIINNSTNLPYNPMIYNHMVGGIRGKKKWDTFHHNGVMFPPEYEPHNIPIKFKNQEIQLSPLTEEYATIYAKYLDTEYIKNKQFKKNFWKDWGPLAKKDGIDNLDDCDFSKIYDYILKNKQIQSEMTKEKKEKIKHDNKIKEIR